MSKLLAKNVGVRSTAWNAAPSRSTRFGRLDPRRRGNTMDRKGRPLTITLKGKVEPYLREEG